MFKVESSIKKPSSDPNAKRKLSTSPILKEINTRDLNCKKRKSPDIKSICKKKSDKKSKISELEAESILKPIKVIKKSTKRISQSSLTSLNISNSLMLPTEVIRKLDHARNWLKSTEEESIISISSESSFSSSATPDIEVQKPPSLSPRIKKKMKIATSTLNEEQQLSENRYGLEMIERPKKESSVTSSKYDLRKSKVVNRHSDNGNSEIQTLKKQLVPLPKKKKKVVRSLPKEKKKVVRKPKSKEKVREEVDDKIDNDVAVTPFKVRDKISDEKLNKRLYNTNESVTKLKVPKNVGKSKTTNKPVQVHDKANCQENLRKKYRKTPKKPITRNVPCSPLSFLSSLSEITGNLPCHPDVVVYKKNFKRKREELVKKLFNLYNKEVFENKLPEDLLIEWNTRCWITGGSCYNKQTYTNNQMTRSSKIVLSTKVLDRPVRVRDTLIHELCHAAAWIFDASHPSEGHGSKWKAWTEKYHCRFPELPKIKRCHNYAISPKYTYKCMQCGNRTGRNTKSLNVERKICGYCFGQFELFVTSEMPRDTGKTKTRPPRIPAGFVLFVKENYAAIKREYNVPHAQVMQLLKKEFAKAKKIKTKL